MSPPDLGLVDGPALNRFIAEVRRDFFARAQADELAPGYWQQNTSRVVAIEVFDGLAAQAQLAIVGDLLVGNEAVRLRRPPEDVFAASDAPMTHIADLVCEVACQVLAGDPAVHVEDVRRGGYET